MRTRNLRPGLFQNEILGGADPMYTLLFQGLWCIADRAGRLEDRALRIRNVLFPQRSNTFDIEAALQWLHDNAFIVRYTVEKDKYIQIVNFEKHQYINVRECASTIPAPTQHVKKRPVTGCALVAHPLETGTGTVTGTVTDRLRSLYPRRSGGQRWKDAASSISARLREGHTEQQLIDGTMAYAAHVRAKGSEGTEFVQQAKTFFGPNKGFLEDWSQPGTTKQARRITAADLV